MKNRMSNSVAFGRDHGTPLDGDVTMLRLSHVGRDPPLPLPGVSRLFTVRTLFIQADRPMRLSFSIVPLALIAVGLGGLSSPALADVSPQDRLKKEVQEMVQEVKKAPSAAEKRSILDTKLRDMIAALDRAEDMGALSSSDEQGIDVLRSRLQENLDELNGHNGFEPVPDGQLNNFADYVQQDFEQANSTVTLSVTTALLILLLIILLA